MALSLLQSPVVLQRVTQQQQPFKASHDKRTHGFNPGYIWMSSVVEDPENLKKENVMQEVFAALSVPCVRHLPGCVMQVYS